MNTKRLILIAITAVIVAAIGAYVFFDDELLTTENTQPTVATTTEKTIHKETETYTIDAKYPVVGIPAFDAAVMSAVSRAMTEFAAYPTNPAGTAVMNNEFTGLYNSLYIGDDIVSVELMISEYTGGAHPNTTLIGINVDRATGKELTLDDALDLIGKSLSAVAAESANELASTLGDGAFFAEGADATEDNYSTFLVDADSVTFLFQSYQVAPYAAGPQKVSFLRVK